MQNPFRILGVYANSAKKDIVKNKGKATAFLKVNKPVEFPLDLKGILPQITRTLEAMNEAEGRLAIAKEQIIYAQFWFLKMTSIDDVAFNHLLANDIDKAISIWSKQDNLSSLQNKVICYLIKDRLSEAISTAELLYNSFGNSYIEKIDSSSTLKMSVAELRNLFIDSLGEEIGMMNLLKVATDEDWKAYINKQTIGPLISKISSEVEKAKNTDHKDPQARLNAARKLYSATKKAFSQLKSLLASSDPQYQMIADKLGLELLQCGIDYYKNTDDDDAAHTAMKVLKQAQLMVVGTLAKQRCEENVKILQKIIDELPPLAVISNHKAIQSYLSAFATQPDLIRYSIQLIKDCAPHLVQIKEQLGATHQYYIKISTIIVNNALGNVIAEVNEVQDADFSTLKNTLISAWRTQLYMDKFDLDPNYKEDRYKECREALYEIIRKCKGFEDSLSSFMYQYGCGWCNNLDTSDVDLRTEEEYYQSCRNLTSYRSYLQRYPSGKYITQAKSRIMELRFNRCKTIADFQKFISDYPNSKLVTKAKEELNRIKKEEEERKAIIERQEKAIRSCSTTDDVITLYNKEKSNRIDIEKCSLKAFEVAKCEEDYRKVISTFSNRTSGGKKAKTTLDEIEKKRKKDAEDLEKKRKNRKIAVTWILIISILLLIILGIYLIWGFSGLSSTCMILAIILGLLAFAGMGSQDALGCVFGIISGIIALGLLGLGGFLDDLSKEGKPQAAEYVYSDANKDTDQFYGSDYSLSSTNSNTLDDSSTIDTDYDTYINNQLKTGAKPYKKYYRSRTGRNYIDFKTSGNDYVVIVRNYSSSDVVNHIYIRAGDSGRLYLPNGTYSIFFYGGKGWNPNMENGNVTGGFVSGGHIQKDEPVTLFNQYGEYTLYPVQNGNLQLQEASEAEAF